MKSPELLARIAGLFYGFLIIAPIIGEVWMLGYLLIIGVKGSAKGTPTVRAEKIGPVLAVEVKNHCNRKKIHPSGEGKYTSKHF
jgi:hypothetical protein